MVTDFRNNECLRVGLPHEMFWIFFFVPKVPFLRFLSNSENLTNFRKTVETGVDPPLNLMYNFSLSKTHNFKNIGLI